MGFHYRALYCVWRVTRGELPVTHEYGDENGCFDDPPWTVIDCLPASARRDERGEINYFSWNKKMRRSCVKLNCTTKTGEI